MKDVCLDLLPARGIKPKYFYQGDCTDENGAFKFDRIPAGTYVIVVNDDGEITSNEPFGTFYYPSATTREQAAEITVGAGDFRENLIARAPQTAEVVTIRGVLSFENGKPAPDESVEFSAETKDKKPRGELEADARATTDAQGRFAVKILKGQTGAIYGSMITFAGEYENCPKLDKLIRAKGNRSIAVIKTPIVKIEAINDLSGIELKFLFPACRKAKIE